MCYFVVMMMMMMMLLLLLLLLLLPGNRDRAGGGVAAQAWTQGHARRGHCCVRCGHRSVGRGGSQASGGRGNRRRSQDRGLPGPRLRGDARKSMSRARRRRASPAGRLQAQSGPCRGCAGVRRLGSMSPGRRLGGELRGRLLRLLVGPGMILGVLNA